MSPLRVVNVTRHKPVQHGSRILGMLWIMNLVDKIIFDKIPKTPGPLLHILTAIFSIMVQFSIR